VLPTGAPLVNRHVRLALLDEAALDELHPLLDDPVV
jgi:hypothetical protein